MAKYVIGCQSCDEKIPVDINEPCPHFCPHCGKTVDKEYVLKAMADYLKEHKEHKVTDWRGSTHARAMAKGIKEADFQDGIRTAGVSGICVLFLVILMVVMSLFASLFVSKMSEFSEFIGMCIGLVVSVAICLRLLYKLNNWYFKE